MPQNICLLGLSPLVNCDFDDVIELDVIVNIEYYANINVFDQTDQLSPLGESDFLKKGTRVPFFKKSLSPQNEFAMSKKDLVMQNM